MTLEPTRRPSRTDPELKPLGRSGRLKVASAPEAGLLAPLDHFKDELGHNLQRAGRRAERKAPGPAKALVQFLVGAASAVGAMADGLYQMVRHPLDFLKGLATLASHVPLSPFWLVRGAKKGFSGLLSEDAAFWKAAGAAYVSPFTTEWRQGRYFAAAGRASVEIGTLVIGATKAARAIKAARADDAARMAGLADDVARAADDSLKSAVLGNELRVSGHATRGEVVIGKADEAASVAARLGDELAGSAPRPPRARMLKANGPDKKAQYRRAAAQLRRDQEDFRRLRQVGPRRLHADPEVAGRLRRLARSVDRRGDRLVETLTGIVPEGAPKRPDRAAAKLEFLRTQKGADLRLGHLDDLVRGRINLEGLDISKMRAIMESLRQHFGHDNLLVNDYVRGSAYYRGSLHIKFRDASGMWYELQVRARQFTTLYETPVDVLGRSTSLHDAIYKGLLKLDDAAIRRLGNGSHKAGAQRVAQVMNSYVRAVDETMEYARNFKELPFERTTRTLRDDLNALLRELPEEHLPVGLR